MRGSTRAPWHIDRSIPYVQGTTVQGNPCKPHMTKRTNRFAVQSGVRAWSARVTVCKALQSFTLETREARGRRSFWTFAHDISGRLPILDWSRCGSMYRVAG